MKKINVIIKLTLIFLFATAQISCFDRFQLDIQPDEVSQTENDVSQIFPTDFVFDSPTSSALYNESEDTTDEATTEINRLLEAEEISECSTTIEIPKGDNENGNCFGPSMLFENHPDANQAANNGTLPRGDLGLWFENVDQEACAANVLNNRLSAINASTNFSRQSLASFACVLRTDSSLVLQENEPLDVTDALANLIDSEFVSVTSAQMTYNETAQFPEYIYSLILLIQPPDDADADPLEFFIDMKHSKLSSDGKDYQGTIVTRHNEQNAFGNCPGNNTRAHTAFYKNEGHHQVFRIDRAEYCKKNDNPFHFVGNTTDVTLDPTYVYDGQGVGGWGNSYYIFMGESDREQRSGEYSFVWQAGPNDGFSRIFNVNITNDNGSIIGNAYFGFGQDLTTVDQSRGEQIDPAIEGFICNWAGPNNDKTLRPQVQQQTMHFDDDLNLFVSDGVNIGFAPTNDCEYTFADDIDGELFSYDFNVDQVLDALDSDFAAQDVVNELLPIDEMDFTAPVDLLTVW